uniref:Putative secreted protein n=1 Tax=Ixodes scapularis TaxID=6945 RepID=A0A4D5RFP5_IXOSC
MATSSSPRAWPFSSTWAASTAWLPRPRSSSAAWTWSRCRPLTSSCTACGSATTRSIRRTRGASFSPRWPPTS